LALKTKLWPFRRVHLAIALIKYLPTLVLHLRFLSQTKRQFDYRSPEFHR